MESPEQDLLPDHLRPFYIEGAIVVRYVRPIAGRPEADVVVLEIDRPWRWVAEVYARRARAAGSPEAREEPFGNMVGYAIGGVSVHVSEGERTTVVLYESTREACARPPAPVMPPPPSLCWEDPPACPAGAVTGGLARRSCFDTTPLGEFGRET